jgi:hypothetical protein
MKLKEWTKSKKEKAEKKLQKVYQKTGAQNIIDKALEKVRKKTKKEKKAERILESKPKLKTGIIGLNKFIMRNHPIVVDGIKNTNIDFKQKNFVFKLSDILTDLKNKKISREEFIKRLGNLFNEEKSIIDEAKNQVVKALVAIGSKVETGSEKEKSSEIAAAETILKSVNEKSSADASDILYASTETIMKGLSESVSPIIVTTNKKEVLEKRINHYILNLYNKYNQRKDVLYSYKIVESVERFFAQLNALLLDYSKEYSLYISNYILENSKDYDAIKSLLFMLESTKQGAIEDRDTYIKYIRAFLNSGEYKTKPFSQFYEENKEKLGIAPDVLLKGIGDTVQGVGTIIGNANAPKVARINAEATKQAAAANLQAAQIQTQGQIESAKLNLAAAQEQRKAAEAMAMGQMARQGSGGGNTKIIIIASVLGILIVGGIVFAAVKMSKK